ncbi:hypothetical protein DQ04_04101020 [Trypanosoma grayi]|uniref:hypothetical protein n=1 Tax=Trypanosoma grayi TaxID=71804 RepID=UPI0004F466BA|nr:hypothetical protein DQ04_04101020 [Trypanosoma grayi]KEG10159.1 hypothetical protein DQ04_04101020 [Trypanosoma grayi]
MSSSTVELVANPSPDVSTHRWSVAGLSRLDRRNKMSSLPFWVPNHVMRKHQFRLIFLRGMVTKGQAEGDAIGLVVELIPPPVGAEVEYPGGCAITAGVVNRVHEDRLHDVTQTETVTLEPACLQVVFPELISPAILQNPEFAEGEEPLLLVEVTIQTGVNVSVERVNKTVSSVWATVSSSISRAVQKASQLYIEKREEFTTREAEAAVAEPRAVPWETVPEIWADRAEAWRHLIAELIVENEGTFRYGPSRGLSKDEQALLLQCGLSQRLIINAHSQFDYDRDVHEGLLTLPALRQQRYHLVPGKMKDEVFWANYFWKVAALSLCKNDEQVRLLLTVLNAPPAVKPRDTSSLRTVCEETVLERVRDAQEAADMLIEYLTDDTEDGDMLLEAAGAACEGHAKQLKGYFVRGDLSEETLKIIGVVLKRLQERLAEYHKRRPKAHEPLEEEEYDSSLTDSATAVVAASSAVPIEEDALISGDAPESCTKETKVEAAVAATMGTATAQASATNQQDPQQQEEEEVEETVKKEGSETRETSAAPAKGSVDAADRKPSFPLMPWEEEDEEEEEDNKEETGSNNK